MGPLMSGQFDLSFNATEINRELQWSVQITQQYLSSTQISVVLASLVHLTQPTCQQSFLLHNVFGTGQVSYLQEFFTR